MDPQLAASWVSAIGSAGSLLGFAAYVLIMLVNRKDQVEVRQEQQAQGVAAWLTARDDTGREGSPVLVVNNGGDTPVFNVKCLFSLPSSEDQHSIALALVPPSTTLSRPLAVDEDAVTADEWASSPAVPEMRFTDSHGTNWQRDGDGRLHRLDRRRLRRRPSSGSSASSASSGSERNDAQWEREHRRQTGDQGTQHHDVDRGAAA